MKGEKNMWLSTALTLIALGVIAFICALAAKGWDFSELGAGKFETREYEVSEDFRSISIYSDTEDITFAASEDGRCRVVFFESEKERHSAEVRGNELTIQKEDSRKWYDHLALFSFKSAKITVYLPRGEYASLRIAQSTGDITLPGDFSFDSIDISVSTGDVDCSASALGAVSIAASTGDIRLGGISAKELKLAVSTGRVEVIGTACAGELSIKVSTGKTVLEDVTCFSLVSNGSTGSITLKNVIAEGSVSIKRSTGDVKLEGCDASELEIKTDTGDVSGTLLTEKVFIAHSDTGRIRVPETTGGGRCKITTDTGSIRMEIAK